MAGTARDLVRRHTRDARISLPREVTRCSTAEASTCVNPANRTTRREEVRAVVVSPNVTPPISGDHKNDTIRE